MFFTDFQELRDSYNTKNNYCNNGNLGKIYSYRQDKINQAKCKKYSCPICRPELKRDLHLNITREIYRINMNKHLIFTFPGNTRRKEITYDQSYPIMTYEAKKLIHVINYEIQRQRKIQQGYKPKRQYKTENTFMHKDQDLPNYDFAMITLPRAQTNPYPGNPEGFCHLHTIINYAINKHWLEEKINKNAYDLGYTFIRDNQSIADYLHKDFFEDEEWYIPSTTRHYRTTRNVKLNITDGYICDQDTTYFTGSTTNKFIEHYILNNYVRILPYEEYIKQFSELLT